MKKIISILTILTLFVCPVFTEPAALASSSMVTAQSAVLLDGLTGRLLYSKSPNEKRAPASTTKILTAMTAIDHMDLNKVLTVPSQAEDIQPSKIYLKAGEKYYLRDLLEAVLIKSANDAAETVAIRVGGSRSGFAKLMNEKAKSIGAVNSNFKTPNGLPAKGQYSTAYDLARIMRAASDYPFIVKTLGYKSKTIQSLGGRSIRLKSNNKMLHREKDVIGKTGWTRKAKYCFVGRIQEEEKSVYIGMLGSSSLWKDVTKLSSYPATKMRTQIKSNQKRWDASEIKAIQRALKNAGFSPGTIDGIFGTRTLVAVEKFQKAKSLTADGIVGPKTWKILQSYL